MAQGDFAGEVVTCLRADGGGYRQVQGQPVFVLHRPRENYLLTSVLEADEEEEQLVLHVLLPVEVPPHKREAVMEYVARANLAHRRGHLDFDPDDTIVLYVAGFDVPRRSLRPRSFQRFLVRTLGVASQHTRGVIAVVRDNRSPVEALERVGCYSLRRTLARASALLDG